jgi:hypothetical protein
MFSGSKAPLPFETIVLVWFLSSAYVIYLFIKPGSLLNSDTNNNKSTTKKVLLTLLGLISGPIVILLTAPFYNWSLYGAAGVVIVVSYAATSNIWKTHD